MFTDILLIGVGFLAGLIGTIIGAGGGFLIIPYLLMARHFTPQVTIATTLAVVFLNTISGSYAYAKQKRIDYQSAWRFALATIPGSIIGSYIAQCFSGSFYRMFFGSFLFLIALYIFYRSFEKKEIAAAEERNSSADSLAANTLPKNTKVMIDAYGNTYTFTCNQTLGIVTSFAVGFLASSLGIGGGIIHVPLLIYVLGFPAHIATATSFFILAISTFFANLPHLYAGNPDVRAVVFLAIGAISGGQIGARLSKKIKGPYIIRALALALLFLSIMLITN